MRAVGLVCATVFAAAACVVDEASDVARYREPLQAGLEAPEDPQGPLTGKLDARRAMALANARNERLPIDGEAYLRALVDKRRQAASWLPRLNFSPSYVMRDSSGGTIDGSDLLLQAPYQVNPKSLAAQQRRARFEARRRLAGLYATQDALLLDVARTLFAVLQAERARSVLENSLALQEARVQDVRARNDVGVARPLDVALSESSLVDARVALINTERSMLTGRALLSFLVAADAQAVELDRTLDIPDEQRSVAELAQVALTHRPELSAAQADVEAAIRAIEVARAQWWPSVNVDLRAFLSRASMPTDQDWSALFGVTLPLLEPGRIRADVADAFSLLREARLRLSLLQRAVRRDVEVAHANLTTGRERVAALRLQLAAADEAFAQAEALYDAGLATNLERVTAQDQRLRTALALENAELELGAFRIDLLRATGTVHRWLGLERPPLPEGDDAEAR